MNLDLSDYRFYEQLSTLQEARDQIKEMDETQIINALDELEKNNQDNFSLRILLYKRWTELNPEAAILHIDDTLKGHYLEDLHHRCVHQWMKVDHIGVLEFFKKNGRLKSNSYYWNFEPVFSKVYSENKSLAVDYLTTIPNKENALKGIFKTLNNSEDFIRLIDLTRKVEDPFGDIKNMTLSKFGEEYTDNSYKWFEEQGHDKEAFKPLFPSWLEKQREKSLERLLKHSENLQDAYNHMADLSNDPKNLQWLSEQPVSKEKDNALAKVVNSHFHMMDVKSLFLSVNSIQNEDLRKSTVQKLLEMADGRITPDDENKLKDLIKDN